MPHIELVFDSGRAGSVPMGPTAYIAMGQCSFDEKGRPMITLREPSYELLEAHVNAVKAALDAELAQAKASFKASNSL